MFKLHLQKEKKNQVLHFRRWSRKGYAIFSTLGRVVVIAVLATGMMGIGTQDGFGQQGSPMLLDTDSVRHIAEVEIQEKAVGLVNPLLEPVVLFTSTEIERAGIRNLQDLLQFVQGVDIKVRGSEGVQADINYRGSTPDQMLIFLYGVLISDPQTGHHHLNIPIVMSEIDRIELLSGADTWSAGQVAFVGAINIVYRDFSAPAQTKIKLAGGDFGYFDGSLSTRYRRENFYLSGGTTYSRSSGYIHNTDFSIGNLFLMGGYQSQRFGNIHAFVGFNGKDFGANSFYSPKFKDQYEETRALITTIRYEKNSKWWNNRLSISHRYHTDLFKLFRSDPPAWYLQDNHHQTNSLNLHYQMLIPSKMGITTVSANVKRESILSNTLGIPLQNPVENLFFDEILYTKGKVRDHFSLALSHQWSYRKSRFVVSIVESGNFDYGLKTSGGIQWERHGVGKWGAIRLSLHHAYRLPTFTDLYYHGPTQQGNPDLKPEQAINGELAYKIRKDPFSGEVVLFSRYGFQLIDWVKRYDEEVWRNQNIRNVLIKGATVAFQYRPEGKFLQSFSLHYTYIDPTYHDVSLQSLYLTDYLKHQLVFKLHHRVIYNFSVQWLMTYNRRNGEFLDPESLQLQSYPPYFLIHLKGYYQFSKVQLFVEIANLLNQKYFDYPHIEAPGRWFKGGIEVQF